MCVSIIPCQAAGRQRYIHRGFSLQDSACSTQPDSDQYGLRLSQRVPALNGVSNTALLNAHAAETCVQIGDYTCTCRLCTPVYKQQQSEPAQPPGQRRSSVQVQVLSCGMRKQEDLWGQLVRELWGRD